MRNGSCKLYVTHTLTANLLRRYLNAALLANLALEANSLVLSAEALPVLRRAKDSLTEKSVLFSSLGTVVDRFTLGYLTVYPLSLLSPTLRRKS